MFCDLHMHSTASDGTDAPQTLGALAKAAGLAAIALTDHDTTAGLLAAAQGCEDVGIDFVPGIEVSADPTPIKPPADDPAAMSTCTLHILGLFVKHDDVALSAVSQRMELARNDRNPEIIRKLNELGVRMDYEEVLELATAQGTAIIGRPHIAQVMMNKGYVKSIQDAFQRYIGSRGGAYVRRDRLHPREAIEAIHHAGGLAILAHPVQLKCIDEDEMTYAFRKLADLGLDGIETRHSDHTPALVQRYELLAKRLNLATTGGSDYHGTRKKIAIGSQQVPLSVYQTLRELCTTS